MPILMLLLRLASTLSCALNPQHRPKPRRPACRLMGAMCDEGTPQTLNPSPSHFMTPACRWGSAA